MRSTSRMFDARIPNFGGDVGLLEYRCNRVTRVNLRIAGRFCNEVNPLQR
jgi:hypothetical protein